MKILPLIFAVITIITPVITQKTGLSKKYGFILKMLCAVLYLVTGVLSAVSFGAVTEYSAMMLGALVLGMLGDFFLEYKGKKLFPLGVVFFALGHIVYSITFLFAGVYKAAPYIAVVLCITLVITAAIVIPAKTKLKLNGKNNLILFYAPVLVFSFVCAVVSGTSAFCENNQLLGLCLISGGSLFFFSDVMIGMDKCGIRRPEFLHYAVSYTYFAAQALFALSMVFQ